MSESSKGPVENREAAGVVTPPSTIPAAGRRVGHYEIVRQIGRGGMAIVYLARQQPLDRGVALKELSSFQASAPGMAARFLREARLASLLNHPNIVTVHEYFEEGAVPYIAMEYAPRGSLRQYVNRISLAQFVGVMEGVLAGLAHAKEYGIVHRDLKPENIMVTSEGRVKIADFGIAKATASAGTALLTATGMTVGTPNYMAPEQAMGEEVGVWTDLYSVGILAWEHLVGQLPFSGPSPMAVLIRQVNEDIPPACQADPAVDPEISAWIDRLLVKDPGARTRSPSAAWEELEEIVLAQLGPRWRRNARLPSPSQVFDTPRPLTPAPFESEKSSAQGAAAPAELQTADDSGYVTFGSEAGEQTPETPQIPAVPDVEPAPAPDPVQTSPAPAIISTPEQTPVLPEVTAPDLPDDDASTARVSDSTYVTYGPVAGPTAPAEPTSAVEHEPGAIEHEDPPPETGHAAAVVSPPVVSPPVDPHSGAGPDPPPAPTVAPPLPGRRVPLKLALSAIAALVAAAVAVVLVAGHVFGGGTSSTVQSSSPTSNLGSVSSSISASTTSTAITTKKPSPPTVSDPAAAGALAAVEQYWHDIADGAFGSAYGLLVPGSVPQSESEFIAQHQQENFQSVAFKGHLSSGTPGGTATVSIVSLRIVSGQYGCQIGSGGPYSLSYSGHTWLIGGVQLSFPACS